MATVSRWGSAIMPDGPGSDGTDQADAACLSAVKDVLAGAPERGHDALAHNVVEFGPAFVACLLARQAIC